MSERLPNTKSTFDLFGIDIERGTVRGLSSERDAKTTVASRYKGSAETAIRFAKWRQDHRVGLTVASFAVAIVGTAVLARIASSPSSSARLPSRLPSDVSAGGRLVVQTPRGEPGRLRAAPSLSAKVLAHVPAGAEVTVLGASGRWYRLATSKGEGWMHADIVRAA